MGWGLLRGIWRENEGMEDEKERSPQFEMGLKGDESSMG